MSGEILVIGPDPLDAAGGISRYLRDVVAACEEIAEVRYLAPRAARTPGRGRSLFTRCDLATRLLGALSDRPRLIIVGHLHLASLLQRLPRARGTRTLALAYGIEAWKPHRAGMQTALEALDRVLAISRHTRTRLLSWSELPPHRVGVLPNALPATEAPDSERIRELRDARGSSDRRTVLTIGRLDASEAYKGHDRLIRAVASLNRNGQALRLVVVGDGDDRERLEALAREHGAEGEVFFTGAVSESDKQAWLHAADAFAMPSTGEGFGFVFLEALDAGLPVLAGATDGSRDALLDGRLGILVDPHDPQALTEGLVRLTEQAKMRPAELERFSKERFSARLHDEVLALLAPTSGGLEAVR